MPSGKNFIASIGVIATTVAIFYYIDSQEMDLDDTTLVKACYAANVHEADCEGFEDAGITWDYKQPCQPFFKADQYYYTPRMIFEATKSGNTTYGQALDMVYEQACGGIKQDADYAAYKAGDVQGRTVKRNLILPLILAAALVAGTMTASDYKACSTKLGLTAFPGGIFSNINDSAQCADTSGGKQPTKCKKYHNRGSGGWWYGHHRHSKNQVNNGCVAHDNCLWNNKCANGRYIGGYRKSIRDTCDGDLAEAAKKCRGNWRCKDSWYFSDVVKGVMSECPNCGKAFSPSYGPSGCPSYYSWCRNVRVLVDGIWTQRSLC